MASPPPSDPQLAAMRILDALDGVLDRHAARPDDERQATLGRALHDGIVELPEAARAPTLHALRTLLPPEEIVPDAGARASSARLLELEDEVVRLRTELQSRPVAVPSAPPTPELAARLGRLLQVSQRELDAASPSDLETRLVETLGVLIEFALGLLRTYVPVTQDEDRTITGLVQRGIADALLGRGEQDWLANHIERTRRQIGGQLLAFRRACDEGARSVLRGLAPAVIEAEASRNAGFIDRIGAASQRWEAYRKRFEEIRTATDLYDKHFDGFIRRELHRLAQEADGKRMP